MPALKRFLCSILILCGLPLLAADSTIGNLSAKTTIPNNYVMPWEDPAVQDWHITFLNLTNQILSGYAPTGMLSGYLPMTGGTVSGAVLSTSSSTNAPVSTELATAGWVRGLFSGGTLLYNTTNLHPVDTNWYSATPFTNSTAQVRTYAGVTNNQYLGTGIMSTQAFTTIYSPMTVNTYLSYNTGGARAATVKPELYYVYTDKANGALTNLLGDYDCGGQALIAGTNLYTFTIPFPTIISTNATGFYVVRRFKVVSQNANPDVSIHGSGSTPSHISFSTPGTSAGDVTAAGNNTFAGTNTFTKPIYLSNSGTNTITLDPATGTVTASVVVTTPVTIYQSSTNLVVNMAAGAYQLLTATNDLHVTMGNIVPGASVLVDITAGSTNRAISFDTNFVWMSFYNSTINSNHVLWLNLTASNANTNGIRASAAQSP